MPVEEYRPHPRDLPDSFETERLFARMPCAGDGAEVNAAIVESWDAFRKWLPWARGAVPTVEESEERARQARTAFAERTDFRFLLYNKPDLGLAGMCNLFPTDWAVPRFEIGYWLRASCVGHGLMTEAVRGITRYAFEHLGAQRVEIRCSVYNDRSRRVAERAGYTFEGILRNNGLDEHGNVRGTCVFSVIPEDNFELKMTGL
jgi:RimJ/RimL family protein N-acetyltransferase